MGVTRLLIGLIDFIAGIIVIAVYFIESNIFGIFSLLVGIVMLAKGFLSMVWSASGGRVKTYPEQNNIFLYIVDILAGVVIFSSNFVYVKPYGIVMLAKGILGTISYITPKLFKPY